MFKLICLLIRSAYQNLIEILFPEFCVGCNKLGTVLCIRCYETLEFLPAQPAPTPESNLDSLTLCCVYDGLAKKLVHTLKYKNVAKINQTIAHILYYSSALPSCEAITYTPMHPKKIGQRGFNQAKEIAQELGKLMQLPVFELLLKTRYTQSQMSLKKKNDRQKNLLGSISLNHTLATKTQSTLHSILLLDDVFTSGTTLQYCAEILKKAGYKQIQGVCFARR